VQVLVPPLVPELGLVLVPPWLELMLALVSANLVWLGLMSEPVLGLMSEPALGLDHPHSTLPHNRHSPHMMYLLGELSGPVGTLTSPS